MYRRNIETCIRDALLDTPVVLLNGARQTGKEDRTKVFISYAHAAKAETGWVERIRIHLKGLVHSKDFEVWDDTKIDAGDKWRDEIEHEIRHTRVAVLVLTADFMASAKRGYELSPVT